MNDVLRDLAFAKAVFQLRALEAIINAPASGMSLRENNEDCSRPKAGSPTGKAGDAQ